MKIGLSVNFLDISPSSPWTLLVTFSQTSHTDAFLSSSVISPRLYCLLIAETFSFPSAIIASLFLLVTTSWIEKVIPATVEYLNPKSLSLSNITDVSVVLYNLKIWAIIFCNVFLSNGLVISISLIAFLISVPGAKKNLSGVTPLIFSFDGSLMNGNVSGNISLKIILPAVVTKYLSFTSSTKNLYLNDETGRAILVCNVISLLS